ncbi:MAG: TerB family tellurite resistance protein [Thiobacillus sp.]|nr:TerB family tellurite resistance protein [Thiobacillus sp.]
MFKKLQNWLRDNIEAHGLGKPDEPETAVQHACCLLLMEVARIETSNTEQKHALVAQVMREEFGLPDAELAAMIDTFSRPENRLTSYFEPASVVNRLRTASSKAHFVEQLWRVAMVDGTIDMYEDHLVRKLSDLLYVSHRDFILAKNKVQAQIASP